MYHTTLAFSIVLRNADTKLRVRQFTVNISKPKDYEMTSMLLMTLTYNNVINLTFLVTRSAQVAAGLMWQPLMWPIHQAIVATLMPKHRAIWTTVGLYGSFVLTSTQEPQPTKVRKRVPTNSAATPRQKCGVLMLSIALVLLILVLRWKSLSCLQKLCCIIFSNYEILLKPSFKLKPNAPESALLTDFLKIKWNTCKSY